MLDTALQVNLCETHCISGALDAWVAYSSDCVEQEFSEVRKEVCSDAAHLDEAHRREGLYAC
jgi:hypothetical protein